MEEIFPNGSWDTGSNILETPLSNPEGHLHTTWILVLQSHDHIKQIEMGFSLELRLSTAARAPVT